jgi:inorganic pyrophosphatase
VYDDPAYADVITTLTKQLQNLRVQYKDSEELDEAFIQKYKDRGLIE